jgi:poly-gamma-glutamate synthase PgsB/CapB
MKLIAILLMLLIVLGLGEMLRHSWYLRRIPIRVHVNGSRGKSSVTRLIVAGLRGGGLRAVAKTTGSAAAFIHADGSEEPVRRRGGPNIREQLRIVRSAVREGAEALVIECMAIRPDLQRVCEERIVRASHGVITNVRPDHLEVMGPTLADAAASLAGTVPRHGHLLTAEDGFADYLAERARGAGSRFTLADAADVDAADLQNLSYVEFPENLALALATCEAAGVPRDRALAGMRGTRPDVGALTRHRIAAAGKTLEFVNAFAANDPVSYVRIWDHLGLREQRERVVVLMNNRADRQRRAKDLAPLFGRELVAGRYVLAGEQTRLMADMLRRQGLPAAQLLDLGGRSTTTVWERVIGDAADGAIVVGIGNIARLGREFMLRVREAEREVPA